MNTSRREFLRRSGLSGVGLLTFHIAGCDKKVTPATARKENAELNILLASEYQSLEAFAEVLVPGSVADGVAHYIDHQLAANSSNCMLMIQYLGVNPPFATFYQAGMAALDQASKRYSASSFAALKQQSKSELVTQMATGQVAGWQGPPPEFFFFVVRSDAVDVRYGTMPGFAELGIPYMAHVEPTTPWGEPE